MSSTSSFVHLATVHHQQGDDTSYELPYESLQNHEITSTTAMPTNENFKNRIVLATKLMGDVLVAVTVTAMAAPFLAVIDKALVERTTAATVATASSTSNHTKNRITVWTSMYHSSTTILQQPMKFLRSPTFLWMWGTYAATYTAANTLRTLLAVEKTPNVSPNTIPAIRDDKTSRAFSYSNYFPSSGTTLLIGTSIVNSTASVMKDRAYAQLYGAAKATTTTSNIANNTKLMVPNITYGLWLLRDLTVIGAAFVLPNHVAQFWIQQQDKTTKTKSLSPQFSDATIIRLSQIGTPVMAQVIAGPLHFIGYDCYNHHNVQASLHNNNVNQFRVGSAVSIPPVSFASYQFWYDRLNNLRSSVGQVIMARMMRIIPGYGIAGICNTELLLQWKNRIVHPMIDTDDFWYRSHNDSSKNEIETTCTNVNTTVWNEHNQHRC